MCISKVITAKKIVKKQLVFGNLTSIFSKSKGSKHFLRLNLNSAHQILFQEPQKIPISFIQPLILQTSVIYANNIFLWYVQLVFICIVGLHKGVPPLFVNLRSLYTDKQKVEIISSLLVQYKEALKLHGHFSDEEEDNPREPASALLWTYYYLAQHYDYLGQTEKALIEIDAAIDHTPTLIELFVTKGRIYKVGSSLIRYYVM